MWAPPTNLDLSTVFDDKNRDALGAFEYYNKFGGPELNFDWRMYPLRDQPSPYFVLSDDLQAQDMGLTGHETLVVPPSEDPNPELKLELSRSSNKRRFKPDSVSLTSEPKTVLKRPRAAGLGSDDSEFETSGSCAVYNSGTATSSTTFAGTNAGDSECTTSARKLVNLVNPSGNNTFNF
jgi:hypothetical protein